MKRKIWKYLFQTLNRHETIVEMPRGAQVLSVGEDAVENAVALWISFDPEMKEKLEQRIFRLEWTGIEFDATDFQFIGTAIVDGTVCHIYEIIPDL